ncbi:hypothetical protein QBC34DRAFT_410870 [Podospora aff. communis PSN243]|uniref:Uncharacterized protein n=1 Tax=Podospora aff. communis PSN243 TaxID=3040156 RepID=A0AAV9GHK3_9PEZI|nr:hypothetical protein QBC34DRAFT_410870 [Podospora aff. communis PSN243]
MSQPTTYALSGENITTTSSPNPLYHLSHPLSSLTHRTTSIQFSRIPNPHPTDAPSLSPTVDLEPLSPAKPALPLYNLIHPSNAQYRTDIPSPFYLTATSPPSTPTPALGNIKFPPSFAPSLKKKYLLPFHKPSFTAFLNPGSSSTTAPLFPSESEGGKVKVLFTAKPSRIGRSWEWLDGEGRVVAREEGEKDGQEATLVVFRREDMKDEEVEALLALWVLRLWWGVAEEREFQKEALMELTPPEAIGNMRMSKMNKRVGALGGFAAAGGAC